MGKGKKKKTGRKKRLQEKQQFKNMSGDQLISRGDTCLANSNVRGALEAYKQAKINKASLDIVMPKLFHAYTLRHKQLKDQKMFKEAEVVLEMGIKIFSSIPVLTPVLLKDCILFFPVQKSLEIYKNYIKTNSPVPEIEISLANRLVAEDSLCLANDLNDGSRLKSDLGSIQNAKAQMEAGNWENALHEMRAVSRKSPYFDMKVFAKAMVSYLKDDRKALEKALCMLNNDFPFSSVSILLREYAAGGRFESTEKYPGTAVLLMGENIHGQTYQSNLERAVNSGNINSINKWIKSLSEILCPDKPETAVVSILELICSGIDQTEMKVDTVKKLLKSNIPSETQRNRMFVKGVSLNVKFLSFYTVKYLETMEEEFPDREERQIAKSIVLLEIVNVLSHDSEFAYEEYDEELEEIFDFFDMPDEVLDEDEGQIIFQIAKKAIDLDPENSDAYDIIMDLPLGSPALRKSMEPILLKKVEVFDKDHLACLKLAELYYMKNAVRKAENILLLAYTRAPHDLQVQEKYAVSFIISSVRNLKHKKWALVTRDLKKAEDFKINSLKILIAEKRLFFHTIETHKFSKNMFETITCGFSLCETMNTLLLLSLDMEDPDHIKSVKTRGFATIFNSFKKRVETLSSHEVYFLLKPMKELFGSLFSKPFFAGPLMGAKGNILSRLSNDDFTNLIVDLVQNDYMKIVIKELEKRRKTARAELSVIFDFYYAALCHFQGGMNDFSQFEEIISRADDPLKERLRRISRTLSKIAPVFMKGAFETFDFQRLDPYNFFPGLSEDGFDEDDFDEDNFDEDNFDEDNFDEDFTLPDKKLFESLLGDVMDEDFTLPDKKLFESLLGDVIDAYFKTTGQTMPGIHLPNFEPKKVFGKNCDERSFHRVVIDLVESADLLVNIQRSGRQDITAEFIDDFSQLISLIKKTGIKSTSEFRKTGRKFAAECESAKIIIRALDRCTSVMNDLSSPEAQHFIMGMRTGI